MDKQADQPMGHGLSGDSTSHFQTLMHRGDVFEQRCPSRMILKHITSSWGGLTLIALVSGTLRFSQLRRKIGGISERMLAQTLQQLEADGLLIRKSRHVVPPHVEYTLTSLGLEAATQIEALANWVENNLAELTSTHRYGKEAEERS